MKRGLWKPWMVETRGAINDYARYVFAVLLLGALMLANVFLILGSLLFLKIFLQTA